MLVDAGLRWVNEGLDSFIGGITKANQAIAGVGPTTTTTGKDLALLGGIAAGVSTVITGAMLQAGKAAIGFAKESVGMAAAFESASSRLKIAGTGAAQSAGIELNKLREAALKVGDDTRLMGVSATGAAEALTDLLKAGLSLNDIMGDFNGYLSDAVPLGGLLAASINLAAASELNMVEASNLASTTMNIFGLTAEQTAVSLDYIVRGADASVASVSDLRDAMTNAGPTLRALGFSVEDATDALALLSNAGIRGSEAGTALRSAFSTMASDKKKVVAAFQEVGISITDTAGNFLSFREILGAVEQATLTMTEAQKRAFLVTISGHYGQTAMNALINQGIEGYDNYAVALQNAAGIMSQAATMSQTLGARTEALEGNIDTLRIEVGDKFIPVMLEVIAIVSDLVQDYGPAMIDWAERTGEAMHGLVKQLREIPDWVVKSAAQVVGLVAVGGTLLKLIPALGGLAVAFKSAVEGAMFLRAGFSLAEVSTLGLSAVIGPLVVILGAAVASILAVNKAIDLHKQITESTQETTKEWTGYLKHLTTEHESATGVAIAYAEKQREINQIYADAPWYIKPLIDKHEILNGSIQDVQTTLLNSATSYEDYRMAVEMVNAEVVKNATWYNIWGEAVINQNAVMEHSIPILDEAAFTAMRVAEASGDAGIAVRMMGQAAQQAAEAELPALTEGAAAAAAAAEAAAVAHEELSQKVVAAWAEVAKAIESGVGSLITNYQNSMEALVEAQASGDAKRLAKAQEAHAQMLADQKEAMMTLLWQQNDALYSLGQITENQWMSMRAAIVKEHGVIINDAQVTTDAYVRLLADWAAGGQTTETDLVAVFGNIGEASAIFVADERKAIEESIANWENKQRMLGQESVTMTKAVNTMSTAMDTDIKSIGISITDFVAEGKTQLGLSATHWADRVVTFGTDTTAIVNLMGDIATETKTNMSNASTAVMTLEEALKRLVEKQWTFTVKGIYDAPPEISFDSPNFKAYYAVQRFAQMVQRTPIEVTVATDMVMRPPPVMSPPAIYNTNQGNTTNVEVNASYANVESPTGIYYDVQAALVAAML